MRVLIDTSFAARGPSGTAVYIEGVVEALRARGNVDVVEPPARRRPRPGGAEGRRNALRSALNALLDAVWVQLTLPRAARAAGADVIHHPLPAHARLTRCAQVVTVHDVAFERHPEAFDPAWRAHARRAHRRATAAAGAVVCVSEATAADAIELLEAPPERVVVVPHGPGQALPEVVAASAREPFLLYVGDAEPRKGLGNLLAAYRDYRAQAEAPLALVLAGSSAALAGRDVGVEGEPEPSPPHLAALYNGAAALVHPSRAEGFGLTLLEAMAAGTPVVAVRNAGVAEVCADAALLVEPTALPAALARIEHEPELREQLAARGRERAAGFSWEASAAGHERAYTLAVSGD